jgi:hypothetical protein
MLEVDSHNLLSMKYFHRVVAGHVYECSLKLSIGIVSPLPQPLHWPSEDNAVTSGKYVYKLMYQ